MIKPVLAICVAITFAAASALADDDVVLIKLDAAKLAYEQEMLKHQRAVHEWIDKREDEARKDGNKKAVDLIKAERRAFDDKNELPRSAPDEFRQNFLKARATLEAAYNLAIKEYVQTKKDYEATVVEKELARLKSTAITVIPTPVAGAAIPVITPELLKAKLAGKASYDAKTGVLTISYRFADKKELEDFDCGEAKLRLSGGFLKLEPTAVIRHVVQFDALAVSTALSVHVMKGNIFSTSNGILVAGGGISNEAIYLDNRGSNGPAFQVVPQNVRSGLVHVEMLVDEKRAVVHWAKEKLGRDLKEPGAGFLSLHGGDAGYGYGALIISGKVNAKWADKFFGLSPVDEKRAAVERVLLGAWKIDLADGKKSEWTFKPDGTISAPSAAGTWEIDLKKEEVLIFWSNGWVDRLDFPVDAKSTSGSLVGRGNIKLVAVKVR